MHAGERVCDLRGAAEVALGAVPRRREVRPLRCRRGRKLKPQKIFYAMLQSVICFSARETTGATSAEPARSHSASSREAAKCDLGRRGRGEAGGATREGLSSFTLD